MRVLDDEKLIVVARPHRAMLESVLLPPIANLVGALRRAVAAGLAALPGIAYGLRLPSK